MLCRLSYAPIGGRRGTRTPMWFPTVGFQPTALPIRRILPWRMGRDSNSHGFYPSPVFETGGLPISFYPSVLFANRREDEWRKRLAMIQQPACASTSLANLRGANYLYTFPSGRPGGSRTHTPCGTTTSRWRVFQFHHRTTENGGDGIESNSLSPRASGLQPDRFSDSLHRHALCARFGRLDSNRQPPH